MTRPWSARSPSEGCPPASSGAGSISTSPRPGTSRTTGTGSSRSGTAAWASGGRWRWPPWSGLWRVRRRGASPAMFMDAVAPALLVAQGIGRIGNYFNQELFGGPTSLPWGTGHRAAVPARRVCPLQHVPAHLPVRADLRPGAGRRPGLAGPSPQRQAAGPVRAVRHRVLGFPDLRGSAARRPLRALPRAAAEHVRCRRRGPGRRRVVLADAAPAPRRNLRACCGTRRAARGSEPGPAIASQPGSQYRWPGLPVKVPSALAMGAGRSGSAGPGAAGCALYPWGYSGNTGQGSPRRMSARLPAGATWLA